MTQPFRKRQLLADLGAVAKARPISAICRIATAVRPAETGAERLPGLIVGMVAGGGGRLAGPASRDLSESLRFAAVMPEADFEGFLAATAILLSDTLQGGEAARDLPWIWDAGRDHYPLAEPAVTAALLRGFAAAFEERGIGIGIPAAALLTEAPEAVHLRLSALPGPAAKRLRRALADPAATPAIEALWRARAGALLARRGSAAADLLSGFRHAFEARSDFAPDTPHLLPFPVA